MTNTTVVRARIDERTKRQAAAALKNIGLTVSDAFRLLMVRVAAEKRRNDCRLESGPPWRSHQGWKAEKLAP
jgi:hypothetical protein